MDIIVISSLVVIPILLYTLNLVLLARVVLVFSFFTITYLEVANYLFFEEFNTRLNYLFIEYLEYPKEVAKMIWNSYTIEIFIIIPTLIYLSYRLFIYTERELVASKILPKILLLPLILPILFLGIRSSIDSSTPNQSFYSYSNSTLKNDIVNNTTFSLLHSIHLKAKEKMPNFGVRKENNIQAIQRLDKKEYLNSSTLLHRAKSTFTKKRDILLLLMESFGGSYVGSLGGTPTTPNFDAMSKEGLFLSNMYSSSNRSNRGFEAVLGSIFPIYPDSYLKLPKSIKGFWTIAKSMKREGYRTVFLYGGDSKFDNMKGFALSNGFDEVVDMYSFNLDIKRYTWGVCDEELYKKAYEILEQSDKPLFLVAFTLSSHKPFDYPDGKIEYYGKEPVESFANSIKYADYALGKFYNRLKRDNFFNNGVLGLVADHNAHISGKLLIPANEFKIPALFIAKDLKPKTISSITHQIDIAPTLLDIAGVTAITPSMGIDLTKKSKSKALIFHRRAFAYLRDNSFVLYQQNKKASIYNFNYQPQDYNKSLVEEGLNYIYGSYDIYNNQLHKDSYIEK
jgi:phosphoglycerol transferase MdoB-like AlkP superfamily enzyme